MQNDLPCLTGRGQSVVRANVSVGFGYHWHDDAGIVTHHVGVTWAFENSLRMINPATAAHYWDYTRDAAADYEWYESPIFDETWFGR